MTCLTEAIALRLADGDLSGIDDQSAAAHLASCDTCQQRVADLQAERAALRAALRQADALAGDSFPRFEPRPAGTTLLLWFGIAVLTLWGINVAWQQMATGYSLPSWLAWLIPGADVFSIDMAFAAVGYLSGDGQPLIEGALRTLFAFVLAAIGASVFWRLLQRNSRPGPCQAVLMLGLGGALLGNAPAVEAFELRHDDERLVVAADEVIDDTLVAAAEDLHIAGTVVGDLITSGRTIRVSGRVEGNLFSAAQNITIDGVVTGSVVSAAETISANDAEIGGNFFGAAREIKLQGDASVGGNLLVAAQQATIEATVRRDLLTAAETVTLLGSVAGDVRAAGERWTLGESARVDGNLRAYLPDEEALVRDPGASIGGEVSVKSIQDHDEDDSWAGEFFEELFGELLKLLAAFLTGLVLFRVTPRLEEERLGSGREAVNTAAFGALALIGTPVAVFLGLITLVGAPLALLLGGGWVACLYLAGIVSAGLLGQRLLDDDPRRPVPLLIGLVILFIAINLPFIGGALRLIAVVIGLGVIVQALREFWGDRDDEPLPGDAQ